MQFAAALERNLSPAKKQYLASKQKRLEESQTSSAFVTEESPTSTADQPSTPDKRVLRDVSNPCANQITVSNPCAT